MIQVREFLARVEEIAAEEPGYQKGHWGNDGYCDCIGLIIGAIRRAGGQWRGIHGSNYAARQEVEQLKKLSGTSDLQPGELVFKAYEPGQGGYALPEKYEPRGEYSNGDIRDYYHVGVVISVYPLKIRHMTTPKPKMDSSIAKWNYHGWLKSIKKKEAIPMGKVFIRGGNKNAPINMRAAASASARIVAEIPQGSEAEIVEGGGIWNQIRWNGFIGYVKSEFVYGDPAGTEMITVSRKELEAIYDKIGGMLGLRG